MRLSSRRHGLIGTLAAVAAIVAGAVGLDYAREWMRIDPFAHLRPTNEPLGGGVGIRMEDVDVWHYEGRKLVGRARVGEAIVQRNRQRIDLHRILEGFYFGDQNRNFRFTASEAHYDAMSRTLLVQGGASVTNKDMSLSAASFQYSQRTQQLQVHSPVTGRYFDGQVSAASLTYDLRTDEYNIGPATWTGTIQEAEATQRRKWTFKTQGIAKRVGDIETWLKAEATDGEVIVMADRIDRDVKTDVITATGNVRYFGEDANLACEKAVVFRKEKRAVLTGNVTMLVKPENQKKLEVAPIPPLTPAVPEEISRERPPAPPADNQEKQLDEEVRSGRSKRKYPAMVYAQKVEYWYAKGSRRATITGNPQARQDLPGGRWRMAWAPVAYYDAEAETLKLVSSPGKKDTRFKTSLGDDLVASWFQVSTKENDDSWEGEGLQGDVYPDEEEVPRTRSEGGATGGGGSSGGGGNPLRGKIGSRR